MKSVALSSLAEAKSLRDFLTEDLKLPTAQVKKHLTKNQQNLAIAPKSRFEIPIELINHLMIAPQYDGKEIEVHFEDEYFICLEKPPKVHGHGLSYLESETITCWLKERCSEFDTVNSDRWERGLLYRLDRFFLPDKTILLPFHFQIDREKKVERFL